MRAVIYARYSSENQREASIEDQVRVCRALVAREGWTHLHVYSDRAISGSSTLRPGYQQLLAEARDRQFDVVVAEALDRLSRDQEDVAGLFKQLRFAGIGIVTAAEGPISELHVGLKGTMNALFLKDLAQKTRRGLEGRVRQGRSAGGRCYGYAVVRRTDQAGEPVHGERRIVDDEAAIVRRVFAAFAAGRSPRGIARLLNGEGVPGPDGRPWRDTTIRGHATRGTGLLNNELYVGRLVWNRQSYVKDPATGRRLARPNANSALVVEAVPELRIVADDLWQAVKQRQAAITATPRVEKIKAARFWTHRRAQHLLTGLIHCGCCGSKLAAIGRDYLACRTARFASGCANRSSIRRGELEDLVLSALRDNLMHPDAVQAFIAAFHEEVNARSAAALQAFDQHRRELAVVTGRLNGLIDAIADGLRTPGLKDRLVAFEQRKAELETLFSGAAPSPVRLHPNLAEVYRRKVADLQQALSDPLIRDEAIAILHGLVDRVVVHPVENGYEVQLDGEIAKMVKLAGADPGHDNAAALRAAACSVKVVAGRGFEPLTFRL